MSGVGVGVPHHDLGVDLQRGHHRDQRQVLPGRGLGVGGGVAEVDRVVGVHLDPGGGEADGGTAGADLEVDAQLLAVDRERAGHDLVLDVDRVAITDQLVEGAVLGLGPPVGLDHEGAGADRRPGRPAAMASPSSLHRLFGVLLVLFHGLIGLLVHGSSMSSSDDSSAALGRLLGAGRRSPRNRRHFHRRRPRGASASSQGPQSGPTVSCSLSLPGLTGSASDADLVQLFGGSPPLEGQVPSRSRIMPPPDGAVLDPAEEEEHGDAEGR